MQERMASSLQVEVYKVQNCFYEEKIKVQNYSYVGKAYENKTYKATEYSRGCHGC